MCVFFHSADKTSNRLGVNEMLIASSVNGFLFGFVSGQPLLILGPTGPFLVFEEMVYDVSVSRCVTRCTLVHCILQLCQSLQSDFWTVRCCVSLWTTFFIIILVAFEGSFMIRHVTRFTEEIFALIIALVYLYEPFKKLYKVLDR
jgi:MFS superfamily sulfate permease-like transporter